MITLFMLLVFLVCACFLVMGLISSIFRFSFHVARGLGSIVVGVILFLLFLIILFL